MHILATLFSNILHGLTEPPETWKVTKLKLLFKKGDLELPKNYRLISIISAMAKLFSTVLYLRIKGIVEDVRSHFGSSHLPFLPPLGRG